MADSIDPPPPQRTAEKQASQARLQAAQQYNEQVQAQREKAPSSIQSGSLKEQQVKQAEQQDAQQAYFGGDFQQKGSSADKFTSAREQALKTGKFDYSAVRSASYTPPETFVNSKGQRVTRPAPQPVPQPERITTPNRQISFGTPVSGPSSSNTQPMLGSKGPVLSISSAQLQKTNALRASQGLPPLETVTTVQIVSPTKGPTAPQTPKLTTGGKAPLDLRTKLAQAQGQVKPTGGGGEAVSFLRFPFSPNKGSSSGGIQSTTILDPLQFMVGGAGGLIEKGASFVGSLIKPAGKTIIKEGSKDIGLNIKPSEAYLKAKSFEAQAARLPKPASVKPTATPKTPTVPTFTSTEVNLGKGLGRSTGKEGGTSVSTLTGKGGGSSPTDKAMQDYFKSREEYAQGRAISQGKILKKTDTGYTTKETTVGKGGLVQLVKEKPLQKTTTVTRQKPSFEKAQLQKQDQFLKQQLKPKTTTKTQAQLKTEDYLKSIQKTKTGPKPRQGQTEGLVTTVPPKTTTKLNPPQPKQKQKQGHPLLAPPMTKPRPGPTPPTGKTRTLTGLVPVTKTGQKQEGLGMTDVLTITVTRGKTPPPPPPTPTTPPPTKTPPNEPTPPDKKRPGDFGGLLGTRSGGLGKVSKSGSRLGYVGNVPLSNIVGMYKRSEVTYGRSAEKLSGSKSSSGKFNKLSNKKSSSFRI